MESNSESDNSKPVKSSGSKLVDDTENSSKSTALDKDKNVKSLLRKNIYPSLVINNRKSDLKPKPRPRSRDDFPVGRGKFEDRRGYRGRGGGGFPRKERDEMGFSRGRFYEQSGKPKTYGSYSSGNDHEGARDYGGNGVPEDSRISTILRKLAREEDESKFAALCKNLQDALALPENASYVRRSLDMILDSLYELFRTGVTMNCKVLAAKSIGNVGYNIEKDFKKYLDWIFTKFNNEMKDANRTLLMKAIYELTFLDRVNPKLGDYAEWKAAGGARCRGLFCHQVSMVRRLCPILNRVSKTSLLEARTELCQLYLMSLVRGVMETTEVGDIFIVSTEIILALTGRYSTTFKDYFHDTVDIIVGWHIDVHQPAEVLRSATRCLQRLAPYWLSDMGFTLTLLRQFLEDAENYKDELTASTPPLSTSSTGGPPPLGHGSEEMSHLRVTETVRKITSFIGVYISVFKGLGQEMSPENNPNVSYAFLIESMGKVMEIVLSTLEPQVHNELIIAGNRCATLILDLLKTEAASVSDPVHIYIYSLLGKSEQLSVKAISSLFRFIAKVLKVLNETTTERLVDTLLQPGSIVLKRRLSRELRADVSAIYCRLLQLSLLPTFAHVYQLIMCDLEAVLRCLSPDEMREGFIEKENSPFSGSPYSKEAEAEELLLFLLETLRVIVTPKVGHDVISFKPSLFDIFAVELPKVIVPIKHPAIHYEILSILKAHCTAYDYFIISDGLVACAPGKLKLSDILGVRTSQGFQTSPTTNYLVTIINLLIKYLKEDMDEGNKIFVIKWSVELLQLGQGYHGMLREASEVIELVRALGFAASDVRKNISLAAIDSLKALLTSYGGLWPHSIMKMFMELCVYFLNSVHPELRLAYHEFMDLLPCLVTAFSLDGIAAEPSCTLRILLAKNYEEMCNNFTGEISGYYFRVFMLYLLSGETDGRKDWLVKMAVRCSPYNEPTYERGQALLGNLTGLTEWAVSESVRHCIEGRLRTVLGKPLETLMAFEVMIRDCFKETLTRRNVCPNPISGLRVRLLIQLCEQLEKGIYNATEGTALAFPLPSKGVATFFTTNRNSCSEWIQRMRFVLLIVCINCGLPTAAVRHGYAYLQKILSDKDSASTPELEAILVNVGRALASMGEHEAVEGLHVWAGEKAGVKSEALPPLIKQAARRYEDAIVGFKAVLDENLPSVEKTTEESEEAKLPVFNIPSLIADQVTECYLALNDWESLAEWKEREESLKLKEKESHSQKFSFIEADGLRAAHLFDSNSLEAAKELLQWSCPQQSPLDTKPSWDYANVLNEMDFTLRNIAISMTNEPSTALQLCCVENIKKCKTMAEQILEDCLKEAPSVLIHRASLLKYVAQSLSQRLNLIDSPVFGCEYKIWKKSIKSPVMEHALWWGLALDTVHQRSRPSQNMIQFTLEVAKVARKEGNYTFADKTLKEHLRLLGLGGGGTGGGPSSAGLAQLADDYMTSWGKSGSPREWTMETAYALREMTKLLMSTGSKEKGIELSSFTALGLTDKTSVDFRFIGATILRKLAAWVTDTSPQVYSNSHLDKLLHLEAERETPAFISHLSSCPSGSTESRGLSPEDTLTGRLLRLSILTYPSMCRSWERLAAWAYSAALASFRSVQGDIQSDDKAVILDSLPNDVDPEKIFPIFTSSSIKKESEDIESDATSTELLEGRLREVGDLTDEQIQTLLTLWRKIHLQMYNYFRLSAYSYFKYIEISEHHEDNNRIVTATLRLLRLVAKHPEEVQEVTEAGLEASPTAPWSSIVPQLFSRLNHPQPYVRARVAELLSRIGLDCPHLIIFPAVVGSHTGASLIREMPNTKLFRVDQPKYRGGGGGGVVGGGGGGGTGEPCGGGFGGGSEEEDLVEEEDEEEDICNEDDTDDLRSSNERAASLENCFSGILETLSKKYGEEISQVKTLVSELRRITLLWDELWLGALTQHQADISRRFLQLQTEVKLTDQNTHLEQELRDHLVAEKHRLILKPLLFVLEQLHAITSVTPETPHEKNFQDKFGKEIEEVLSRLRDPPDPRSPQQSWAAIKSLQQRLHSGLLAGAGGGGPGAAGGGKSTSSSHRLLTMTDISPQLAGLRDSAIAMPGLRDPVTIQSIHNDVAILPTKTKPKKLIFNGSDGKQYTYLFKGLEDLHLDERIMQFLSIANSMLREERLRARHYSVIPLGPRSGLISWVESVSPIFSLYKKWQQRQAANTETGSSTVLRPSELFYSKLAPILKEVGISKVESVQRNKWPLSALKKCLLELMTLTPDCLLSRELWCHSMNSSDWWQVTKLYSSSLAVMSMIGYVIGLGDRHLDNVLVNLKTGEVVHIDYNVCFEKGKTLRVPEKVPFRLTPNLEAALGVTGIEGVYRLTCEHVLRTLKGGSETLLTLLEAFVYDPLIDWTPLSEGGYTGAVYGGGRELASETKQSKKDLEREVTCSMFHVRMIEVEHQWLENKTLLLSELEDFLVKITGWRDAEAALKKVQQSLQERHSQLSILKEAEGQPNHSLYTLGLRYAKHMQVLNAKESVSHALKTRIQDCDTQIASYQAVLAVLKGPEVSKWISEVATRPKEDVCQVFDLIKEFLQNAGQNQMVQQCIVSEREVGELCCQQSTLSGVLLEMLAQYYQICRLYPASTLLRHRSHLYRKWCLRLLEDMSPPTCEAVLTDIKSELSASDETMRMAAMFSVGLHRQHSEAGAWLRRAREQLASLPPRPGFELEGGHRLEPQAVEAVALASLTSLNRKFLTLEAAATSAGDCLLNLTSKEGRWFLDDMVLLASTGLHLIQLIPSLPSLSCPRVETAIRCLNAAFAQYKALQDAHLNFTNIILVEAMQGLECEEPSVVRMVERLDALVSFSDVSLSDLLHQLELHLRFTVMGMVSPHGVCLRLVEKLKDQYYQLMEMVGKSYEAGDNATESGSSGGTQAGGSGGGVGSTTAAPLSQGEMLLMGFDGLFTNVDRGRELLLGSLTGLEVDSPQAWKTVDQIREAKSHYTAPVCQKETREVLEGMFFVKRLDTILTVLRLLTLDARGFRAQAGGQLVPSDLESLTSPVRKYIADYVCYQLHGVFPHCLAIFVCLLLQVNGLDVTSAVEQKDIGAQSRVPLEELCKKLTEGLSRGWTREASGLVSQEESGHRHSQLKYRLEQELVSAEGTLLRAQLRLTAHFWLYEHYLVSSPPPPINRVIFLTELRKASTALGSIQPKLAELLEAQNSMILSAEQRLKWAAGANPALAEVMTAFESSVKSHRERVERERTLAQQVLSMANTVFLHEVLRTPTQEAVLSDNHILKLVEDCEKTYGLVQNIRVVLASAEDGLVLLVPPKKRIDSDWISLAEEKISESIQKLKSELEPMQMSLFAAEDCLKNRSNGIRSVLAKHHRIIADIKTLLKSLLKYEDAGLSGLEDYLSRYKQYTERLNVFTKTVTNAGKMSPPLISMAEEEAKAVIEQTGDIYSGLLKFTVSDCPLLRRPPLVRQGEVSSKPNRATTGSQERNAYAMSVWRRVKFKLEGRDPDPSVRLTEKQQVDWTIREATNLDNLALLYEGWTPWV